MRVTITSALFLFTVIIINGTGNLHFNSQATASDVFRAESTEVAASKQKWDWWTGGTQLRGANIWLKRTKRGDGLGTGVVGPPYTREDFKALKAWGANYVNLSYPGIYREEKRGGRYELETPVLDELKTLVCDAGRAGLLVVVSFRTGPRRNEAEVFDEDKVSPLWGDPKAQAAWVDMWRNTALELKRYPHMVGYDLMVEPEIPTRRAAEWDKFARRLIETIRADVIPGGTGGAGDKETPILVGGVGMSDVEGLAKLNLSVIDPRRDSKIVYTVHQYEPNEYTQQTEGKWSFDCKTGKDEKGVPKAGDYKRYEPARDREERDFLDRHYQQIRDWREANKGRDAHGALPPVAVNEFGVIRWAGAFNKPDGDEFLKRQFEELEKSGFNHAIWKWDPAFCQGDDDYDFRHGQEFSNHGDVDSELSREIRRNWQKNDPDAVGPAESGSCPAIGPQTPLAASASAVGINGSLRVCGNFLCNQHGKPIQLRGMSTHGLQWYGWGKCLTLGSLDALATEWGADVVRVSMYVQEGGYEDDPAGFTAQAERVVDTLINRGLYVVIDWHILNPGDPMHNLERAKVYFAHMSKKYGSTPNVLYEIANEPNGKYKDANGTKRRVDWARIRHYADQVNAVIRASDPDGIIIVGTPDWSSLGVSGRFGPSEVYNNPLTGTNIMYSFHFYAAEHRDKYLSALEEASARLPIFVTEWGTQKASGDGNNDFASAQRYVDLMARKKISWVNWNYSDDQRSGAVFNQGVCPNGPWVGAVLKPAGAWVRERIMQPADDFPIR